MNKEDIIKEYNLFINKFNLKPEEFVLGAGGACLMYGLRETTDDMDTDISNEIFDKLLKSKKYKLSYFGDVEVLEYNQYIDLHRRVRKFETQLVDGVCCYSPKELLAQKEKLNRPKDQNDIKLLKELIKQTNNLKAIIIKGNPKYINNDLARKYYKSIEEFLKDNGVSNVEFDDGKEYTRPKLNADIYIAHSRGCSRYDFMPKDKQKVFLKLGVPEGIIDPIDLKWQQEVWTKDTDIQPPNEHFIFSLEQKEAVLKLINQVRNISLESITSYIDIPKEVLDIAKTDPIIGTYVTVDKPRIGIYHNDRVVGFYSPFQEEYKGITYWRTGNIYVLPEYRNKGLGTEALIEFFADKPYGMATIVFSNKASLKAFEKAGFRIDYNFIKLNPKGVQLYLLLKKPQEELKPAFLSWK